MNDIYIFVTQNNMNNLEGAFFTMKNICNIDMLSFFIQ